ncbi:MAG: VOC family protein [Alphaproteobacteria bacterium]
MRYVVDDLKTMTDFYVTHLGFELDVATPAFAALLKDGPKLLLSAQSRAGGRPMSGGVVQSSGVGTGSC